MIGTTLTSRPLSPDMAFFYNRFSWPWVMWVHPIEVRIKYLVLVMGYKLGGMVTKVREPKCHAHCPTQLAQHGQSRSNQFQGS